MFINFNCSRLPHILFCTPNTCWPFYFHWGPWLSIGILFTTFISPKHSRTIMHPKVNISYLPIDMRYLTEHRVQWLSTVIWTVAIFRGLAFLGEGRLLSFPHWKPNVASGIPLLCINHFFLLCNIPSSLFFFKLHFPFLILVISQNST